MLWCRVVDAYRFEWSNFVSDDLYTLFYRCILASLPLPFLFLLSLLLSQTHMPIHTHIYIDSIFLAHDTLRFGMIR